MKVVCGLGNPGSAYERTRHNVGWWAIDHVHAAWGFGRFRSERGAVASSGERHGESVLLMKPLTYMNRSGNALAPLLHQRDFDVAKDLLVVVDDVALPVGRIRVRARGSAGGHNGLKSVEATLGTREYARLRIGVGAPPPGRDLAEWVLSPFDAEDEDTILSLLPLVGEVIDAWIREGVEAAIARAAGGGG